MKHTEMIIVIQAHSEGKAIQSSSKLLSSAWRDADSNGEFNFIGFNYRVKPEPVYGKINVNNAGIVYIGSKDGAIEERNEYVSINAFEDALNIIEATQPEMSEEQYQLFKTLKELL